MHVLKIAMTGLLLFSVPAMAHEQAHKPIIKYRQALMRAQSGHLGALFQVAGGQAGKREDMLMHAQALSDVSDLVIDAFGHETDGDKTRAKPAIWSDFEGFRGKARDMQHAAAALLEAIKAGDDPAIATRLEAAGDACGACHKKYRVKKN